MSQNQTRLALVQCQNQLYLLSKMSNLCCKLKICQVMLTFSTPMVLISRQTQSWVLCLNTKSFGLTMTILQMLAKYNHLLRILTKWSNKMFSSLLMLEHLPLLLTNQVIVPFNMKLVSVLRQSVYLHNHGNKKLEKIPCLFPTRYSQSMSCSIQQIIYGCKVLAWLMKMQILFTQTCKLMPPNIVVPYNHKEFKWHIVGKHLLMFVLLMDLS